MSNFVAKYHEKPAHTLEDHEQMYTALNSINSERDGVNLEDIDQMK